MKSRFLANMSHEIRTPIHGIMGLAQLLVQSPLDAKQKRWVELMARSVDTLHTVVNDILDYSKLEAVRVHIAAIAFDPHEVVRDVVELHAPRAAENSLFLDLRLADDLPTTLIGDPAGWCHRDGSRCRRSTDRVAALRGHGHGRGPLRRDARATVPALRAGRWLDDTASRRHRPRARHQPAPDAADGRHAGRDIHARQGLDLLVRAHLAGCSRLRGCQHSSARPRTTTRAGAPPPGGRRSHRDAGLGTGPRRAGR